MSEHIKLTTPFDMAPDLSQLDKALRDFEKQFLDEDKGLNRYHLVIDYKINKPTCDKIQKLYSNAGWKYVQCKTSSDNGERPGLTGLILQTYC